MDAVAAFYSERLFLAVRVVADDSPAMQRIEPSSQHDT